MALKWPDKDPNEVLDYQLRWTKRVPSGDEIAASDWIVPTASPSSPTRSRPPQQRSGWLAARTVKATRSSIASPRRKVASWINR
jgi:hypothetical protein